MLSIASPLTAPFSPPKGVPRVANPSSQQDASSQSSSEVSVLSTNASGSSIAVLSRGGTEDSREELALALDMESANEEFVRTSALSPLVKKANSGPMVESSSSGNE